MTEEAVASLVRAELQKYTPGGITLDVIDGQIQQRDGYRAVGVLVSGTPSQLYELYTALADVEETIAETTGVEVITRYFLPEELALSGPGGATEPAADTTVARST